MNTSTAATDALDYSDHADDGTHPLSDDDTSPIVVESKVRNYHYRSALADKICESMTSVGLAPERVCNDVFMLPTSGRLAARVSIETHCVHIRQMDLANGSESDDTLPRGLAVWEIVAELCKRAAAISTEVEADVPF
jgi:hypothetical protein